MSDSQCVGICMIDPDTGVCLGCGRLPEEISGVPQRPPAPVRASTTADGLPPAVAAAIGEASD